MLPHYTVILYPFESNESSKFVQFIFDFIWLDYTNIAKLLIASGANVNIKCDKDKTGATPLHSAASYGKSLKS